MYSRPGMPTEEITLGELFKSAGYATGLFGKWHLGYSKDTIPPAQGFDESYGMYGGVIDSYSHYTGYEGTNRHDLWKNGKEVFEPDTAAVGRAFIAEENAVFLMMEFEWLPSFLGKEKSLKIRYAINWFLELAEVPAKIGCF
jgi:arylsulfatase A-like enzyme